MIGGDMHQGTVVNRLIGWSKWKLASGVALGYPSMVSFMRLGGETSSNNKRNYDEVDSWCVETDDAFKLLPVMPKEIIKMEYLSTHKIVAVKAHQMGISKRAYHKYLNDSYMLLGNILDSRLRNVHDSDTFLLNQSVMRHKPAQQTG